MKIREILAREIIDSRGNPTIEVDIISDKGFGRAAVPSGASTGRYEALELRDNDKSRFLGKGVLEAVKNVNEVISLEVKDKSFTQDSLDKFLCDLDGTENKSKLGANAILGVSLAFAHAYANSEELPLFAYFADIFKNDNIILPRPMFNIMNGGKHANWSSDIQEFMIIAKKDICYRDQLRQACEVFLSLEKLLKAKNLSVNVGNEGGFAPELKSNAQAIDIIIESVEKAGYVFGEDIGLGFDFASTEFYDTETGKYNLKRDNLSLSSDEMISWICDLESKYPIISLEDPLAEDDWKGWQSLTNKLGNKIQILIK